MKQRVLMGFDFGTGGVKALAYGLRENRILKSAYRSYPLSVPKPNCAEQAPEEWWNAFAECVRELLSGGFMSEDVAAISVSSHTPTLTPFDGQGKALTNGMIWADGRAVEESRDLSRRYGDVIRKANPASVRPYHILPKLLWFQKHNPELYEQTTVFLDCNGYINYRLTGICALDRSMATNYHFYNVYTKQWDQEVVRTLGIDLNRFPKLHDCGEIIGTVTEEAAWELGLAAGIRICAGSSDTAMAMLSTGIVSGDRLAYSCGTGSSVILLEKNTEQEPFQTCDRLLTIAYTDKEYMMNIGVMSNTGGAFQWVRDVLCGEEKKEAAEMHADVYEIMDRLVAGSSPGAGGIVFLPYLAGELSPLYCPEARGVFFGLSGAAGKKELVRAVMEGTCYAAMQNVKIVLEAAEKSAENIKEIVATGGPCKSAVWMQMLSDICGIPVAVQEKAEGAALGDVIMAGCAVGIFESCQSAVECMVVMGNRYEPDWSRHRRYLLNYQTYCELQEQMLPVFENHAARMQSLED